MTKDQGQDNLAKMVAELEEISRYFSKQDLDLDEGLKKYEEGMKLAKEIKSKLKSFELKINEIKSKYE